MNPKTVRIRAFFRQLQREGVTTLPNPLRTNATIRPDRGDTRSSHTGAGLGVRLGISLSDSDVRESK